MTKKFSFRFVVIMLSLLTIVGINAALAQEEKTLVIGINAAPASLDALHEGGSIVNIRHYGMIYDTLVRTMADASLAPMLATE